MSNNFQLSQQTDPNKIFLTKFSKLEGRFDPHFYKLEFQKIKQNINQINNNSLKNIANFSNETWNQKDFFLNTFPYIEIGEIDTLTGTIKQINNIEIKNAPSRAKMLVKQGDILISTTRPNRGAITFLEYGNQYIASTGFSVIRKVKEKILNKKYLFYVLRLKISLLQMEQRSSGGNYPAITQDELKNIKIPMPPKNIQAEIVAKMDTAYQDKKDKETQAQNLLDSIDTYLLNELGIDLPKPAENSLKARIFTKKLSDIADGRFDAEYYQNKYTDFDLSLNNARYKISNIDNIITSIVSGSTPKSGGSAYQDNGKYHFIRLTNFNNSMEVDLSKSLFIKENVYYEFLKRSRLKKGDVLFGIAGSIGKIAIYNHNEKANINQAIARLRFKDNINYIYIAYLLNSSFLKYQIERNKRPVAQPNLNTEELKSLKIPLPPLEKQNQIAEHISKIREQAKQLQTEAKTGLEQAKQQVECIILGNNL